MKPRTMVLNFMLFGLSALTVSQATVPVEALGIAPLADTAARYSPAKMFRSGGLITPLTGVPQFVGLIGATQRYFLDSNAYMFTASGGTDDLNPFRDDLNPFRNTGFLQEPQAYFVAGEAPHAFR